MKGADDATVAQWIRDDRIDILIDIAGHTGHNRLGVFGPKPAPVQITWLDYLNTTGLAAIDYRLTDAVSDPPGTSEALRRESAAPPGAHAVVLESAGHGAAAHAAADALGRRSHAGLVQPWGEAHGCDACVVVASAHGGSAGATRRRRRPRGRAQARIRAAFGATAPRVRIFPRLSVEAFRREAAAVDLALDPVPFSGAATTLEMLWQGVPVVTLPGTMSPSRSTASMLAYSV